MGDPADRHRVIPAGDCLENEAGCDERAADAAVLRGNGDAEIPRRAEARKEIVRPPLVAIHARRERVKLAAREPVGLVEDLLLFGGQLAGASRRGAHRKYSSGDLV
jgi:hypothetical protein